MGDRPDVIKELNEKVAAARAAREANRAEALKQMKESVASLTDPKKP